MTDDTDTPETEKPKRKSKSRKAPFGVIDGGKHDEPIGSRPIGRPTKYHPYLLLTISYRVQRLSGSAREAHLILNLSRPLVATDQQAKLAQVT